jgi:hypothetical protein
MRCTYCEKSVLGSSPITVPGIGPAHVACHQTNLISERIFAGLNIAKLSAEDLNELSDLVRMEQNSRMSMNESSAEVFEDELWG